VIGSLLRPLHRQSDLAIEPAVDLVVEPGAAVLPVAEPALADLQPAVLETARPPVASPLDWAGLGSAAYEANTTLRLELIGSQLRAAGLADIGRFPRLTDYVNLLDGFFQLSDVKLLTRIGATTRVSLPNLRVRLDEVTLVAEKDVTAAGAGRIDRLIEKQTRRLVVITPAHIISGETYLHEDASLTAFVDSTDPHFMPMTNVRVRWLADRRLVGRYPFALLQRSHIIGIATETPE
jgi:hypothetical protein